MLRRQRRSSTPGATGANNARNIRRAYRAADRLIAQLRAFEAKNESYAIAPGGYYLRLGSPVEVALSIARYLEWQRDQLRYADALRALCPSLGRLLS